jgi:uncharacterized protein (TIGR02145 family)
MKMRNIVIISSLFTFFLLSNSFLCPSSKKEENADPVAEFTIEPEDGSVNTEFKFDASGSHDEEDPVEKLMVKWCFYYTGYGDQYTGETWDKVAYHKYTVPGTYSIECVVMDTYGNEGWAVKSLQVTQGSAPNAVFTIDPQEGNTTTIFTFDASECFDNEDPVESLQVRWDWENDGEFDTDYSTEKIITHQYTESGDYEIKLEVKDTDVETGTTIRYLTVSSTTGWKPCVGFETITYGGKVYNTAKIGNQCWLKENLDIGDMIPVNTDPSDNSVIEKYCYNDDPDSCDKYGGLYAWNEMMQYVTTEGARGICPEGWHIPTDNEWKILEGTVDTHFGVGDPEWDKENMVRGWDVGIRLKSTSGWIAGGSGYDSYGFTALPAGYRHSTGQTFSIGQIGYFWSSTDNYNHPWQRELNSFNMLMGRYTTPNDKETGCSVRCMKDE